MDVYSRYPAVVLLPSERTASVIEGLRSVFVMLGYPKRIISDNGPQFVSEEFLSQLSEWNVVHERIVPYTPRQNPVERLHQTLKRLMRKSGESSAKRALQRALETVRSTINATTGRTPGDLMLRGGFSTPLRLFAEPTWVPADECDEDVDDEVRTRESATKASVKEGYDKRHHAHPRDLAPEMSVFVQQPSGATDRGVVLQARQQHGCRAGHRRDQVRC